jgi:hypothetical protein
MNIRIFVPSPDYPKRANERHTKWHVIRGRHIENEKLKKMKKKLKLKKWEKYFKWKKKNEKWNKIIIIVTLGALKSCIICILGPSA